MPNLTPEGLKRWRADRGYTLIKAAAAYGVGVATYKRYESGRVRINRPKTGIDIFTSTAGPAALADKHRRPLLISTGVLKAWRAQYKMTTYSASNFLGVDESAVEQWEEAMYAPPLWLHDVLLRGCDPAAVNPEYVDIERPLETIVDEQRAAIAASKLLPPQVPVSTDPRANPLYWIAEPTIDYPTTDLEARAAEYAGYVLKGDSRANWDYMMLAWKTCIPDEHPLKSRLIAYIDAAAKPLPGEDYVVPPFR